MRTPQTFFIISAAALCLGVCGCAGDLNAYMADRSPAHRHDSMIYPATRVDIQLWNERRTGFSSFGSCILPIYLLADMPISIATDTVLFPICGTAELIHGNSQTNSVPPNKSPEPTPVGAGSSASRSTP